MTVVLIISYVWTGLRLKKNYNRVAVTMADVSVLFLLKQLKLIAHFYMLEVMIAQRSCVRTPLHGT